MEANTTTGITYTKTDIPLKQMSQFTDGIVLDLMKQFGNVEDFAANLVAADLGDMELAGTLGNAQMKYISLTFNPCNRELETSCASDEEIRSFLAINAFSAYGLDNFVDLSEVNPVDTSLNQIVKLVFFGNLDLDNPLEIEL